MLVVLGCGGALPSTANPDAPAKHEGKTTDAPQVIRKRSVPNAMQLAALADRGWEVVESRAVGLRVPLPDARRWREPADERWLVLTHAPSSSSLRFRTWSAPVRVNKEACREQVYLWRSELRPGFEPMVEGSLAAPSGYDVGLRIDVARNQGGALGATLLAYGAGVRRCYAAVFQTAVTDARAESELGARLRLVTEGVLNRVELIDIEEIPSQRPFSTP